jgi:8-oxo-dGTP pyrophosphatase MutT (NUDIX family)
MISPSTTPTLDDVQRALTLPNFDPISAQLKMAPRPRPIRRPDHLLGQAKIGGVLILLYPLNGELTFVLTRRTESVALHKGQISLPGGAQEAGETGEQTALRETCEELCVSLDTVDILGKLTPLYIPPSDFEIHPAVAHIAPRPTFRPDPVEVAEILELPLPTLLDDRIKAVERWNWGGHELDVPFYRVGGYPVWGATAIVLSEFEQRLRIAQSSAG